MKIGDEVYIHGYIDEIRNDVVIIKNEGGYFGTVPNEIKLKTESKTSNIPYKIETSSVSKTEPQKCENCNHYKLTCDLFSEICKYEPRDELQIEESQFTKQCHKPSSSYYRCYCDERKEDEYCNGCRFWYEPQKAIKDLQEYYGIKQEPMLSDEEWKKDGK